MVRRARVAPGGWGCHGRKRAVAGRPLVRKEAEYQASARIMIETQEWHLTRVLAGCLRRTHWHFVVWPQAEGELPSHFRWLTQPHARRWLVAHGTVGCGHLDQGRFKCLPVAGDEHFFTGCRYVERNALTAGGVGRAEDWRWGSLWAQRKSARPTLSP